MNTEQLTIDFSALHHIENSMANQLHFETHKEEFSKQCRIVYEAFLRGERLTTTKALLRYKIGDLRRRCKDLRDMWNVPVESEYVIDEQGNNTRYKEYFLQTN